MRIVLALLLLTLSALVLRLWGIDHGLPHNKEADAHMALHVERLRQGLDAPDPRNNDNQYPNVLPELLAFMPSGVAEAPGKSLEEHLRDAGAVYREMRVEIALCSVFLVVLTFALARRFVSRGWSVFAAALVATSFLLQFFGQQARPHAAAASFFLAAVLASMHLARAPRWWSYLLACAATALAIGVLHSGLATLLPLALAACLAVLPVVHESAGKLLARLALAPLVVLAVGALALRLFYPYLWRDDGGTSFDEPVIEGARLVWGDHRVGLIDFRGHGFGVVARTLWFYEPVLASLLLVALAAWFVRKPSIYRSVERWSDFWVAAAFALPYLLAIGLFERTFERFVIPLVPFAAVAAAWGLEYWSAKLARSARTALVLGACAALALPAFACGRLAWLRSRDDTLERAAHWIAAQADAPTTPIYVAPFFDLPLARSRDSLEPADRRPKAILSRWSIWQKRVGPDVVPAPRYDLRYLVPRPDLGFDLERTRSEPFEYVRALGPGYFVIDMTRQPFSELLERLQRALLAQGELVARFAPETSGPSAAFGLGYEDELVPGWPNVFARTLRVEAVGPVVEVYRVR